MTLKYEAVISALCPACKSAYQRLLPLPLDTHGTESPTLDRPLLSFLLADSVPVSPASGLPTSAIPLTMTGPACSSSCRAGADHSGSITHHRRPGRIPAITAGIRTSRGLSRVARKQRRPAAPTDRRALSGFRAPGRQRLRRKRRAGLGIMHSAYVEERI